MKTKLHLTVVAALYCVGLWAAEAEPAGAVGPVNPDFLRWLQMDESERQESFHGFIPSPTDVKIAGKSAGGKTRLASTSVSLPSRYEPLNGGKTVAVRDQGEYGTCWAHAAMATLEFNAMQSEGRAIDFSESHLINNNRFDYPGWNYGNSEMAQAYFLRWEGPVLEYYEKYPQKGTVQTVAPARHVQRVCHVAGRSGSLDNDAIKQSVMKYGALSSAYYHDDNYYSSANKSYCYPNAKNTNHQIAIVGWDDAYPKENFSAAPSGNGAFICRNSWSENWGRQGYFYLSYYDANIGTDRMHAFVAGEYADNYESVYQHDEYGFTGYWGWQGVNDGWCANIYTAKKAEQIAAVGFYTLAPNSSYKIKIYTGCTASSPISGTEKLEQTGTLEEAGFSTIKLSKLISVGKNARFSVVVYVNSPGASYPLALEYKYTGYTSKVTVAAGESFYSYNGKSWNDFYPNYECHFCVKAYTVAASQPKTSVSTGSVPYSWIDDYAEVLAACGGDYETAASQVMANGCQLYRSYVAMLDPTDASSKFQASIAVTNNTPYISWTPSYPDKRLYQIQGKASFSTAENWAATNSTHRFFRVVVTVP